MVHGLLIHCFNYCSCHEYINLVSHIKMPKSKTNTYGPKINEISQQV